MTVFTRHQKQSHPLAVSSQQTFNIKVPYEYPFSMHDKELRKAVNRFVEQYNEIYASVTPIIYIRAGEHQDGEKSTIDDVSYLIDRGNNELSRRTNEKILKASFIVTLTTLFVAIASCVVTIVK